MFTGMDRPRVGDVVSVSTDAGMEVGVIDHIFIDTEAGSTDYEIRLNGGVWTPPKIPVLFERERKWKL